MKPRDAMPAVVVALGTLALWGCAQIVGIQPLPDDGGTGGGGGSSGSSSGSSSGGTSSGVDTSGFLGTWTYTGTVTYSGSGCSDPGTQAATPGSQTFTQGPGANQVSTPGGTNCPLVFTVRGDTATMASGPTCAATASDGDPLSVQYTTGLVTLSSPTTATVELSANVTDTSNQLECTATQDLTMTK